MNIELLLGVCVVVFGMGLLSDWLLAWKRKLSNKKRTTLYIYSNWDDAKYDLTVEAVSIHNVLSYSIDGGYITIRTLRRDITFKLDPAAIVVSEDRK